MRERETKCLSSRFDGHPSLTLFLSLSDCRGDKMMMLQGAKLSLVFGGVDRPRFAADLQNEGEKKREYERDA